jgi:transcriptional regulator with XRE-family HTH domain
VSGIGSFIARRRRALDLTAAELAERAGTTRQVIANLENGRVTTLPAPEIVRALAAALDVPVTSLLTAAGYLNDPE